MYYAQRFGVSIRPRVLAARLEGRGHKVHAASIPREEWVAPEELTFGRSRRFWTISGDSPPITQPPDGWKPVRSRLYADAEGTRLSITQWEAGQAIPTSGRREVDVPVAQCRRSIGDPSLRRAARRSDQGRGRIAGHRARREIQILPTYLLDTPIPPQSNMCWLMIPERWLPIAGRQRT